MEIFFSEIFLEFSEIIFSIKFFKFISFKFFSFEICESEKSQSIKEFALLTSLKFSFKLFFKSHIFNFSNIFKSSCKFEEITASGVFNSCHAL
jgi:hypothetical protein